jgi:hypothetical protein
MGSAWFEIEFFCVVELNAGPWSAKARLEEIDEFGKDADDGNKCGELHTDQPGKLTINISELAINFGKSAIHIRA